MEYTTIRLFKDTKSELREFEERPNDTDDHTLRRVIEKARKYEEESQ